jgi:hypothetical protein
MTVIGEDTVSIFHAITRFNAYFKFNGKAEHISDSTPNELRDLHFVMTVAHDEKWTNTLNGYINGWNHSKQIELCLE